jgi:hypothetical protein
LSPEEVSRLMNITEHCFFSWRGVFNTSPNLQVGGTPLVGCPRLLILFIHSYPPYRRPFLYLQPEDAPCRDDKQSSYILESWALLQ